MSNKALILFIDDDKHLTRIMRDLLKHEGFDVRTAGSAEEGLRLLQGITPDLIVLDISMPGIGGIGLLKRIAKPDGSLKHPVLVLTARAVMKDFFDTVAVDGFLPKPCSEQEIMRKINEIIRNHAAVSTPAAPAAGKSRRITVVVGEDDADMRNIYEKAFTDAHLDIYFAHTGPQALEQAVETHPDAIVMKEVLPNMNGSVVARLVKAMPHTRKIPIIVHDDARTTKPSNVSNRDVDQFLFSSMAHDLVAAVQQTIKH